MPGARGGSADRRARCVDLGARTPIFPAELVLQRGSSRLRADELEEVARPLDQLHRDGPLELVGVQLVQRDQVWMHQVGDGAELAMNELNDG